jgi:Amidohydrolase family
VAVGVQAHKTEQLVETGAVAEALGAAQEGSLDLAQRGLDGADRVRAQRRAGRELGGEFSAEELCAMATRNPADALGWSARLGRLKEGLHGDVLVTTDRGGSAYRNLIESVERDVQLEAINGQPFYGTTRLMEAAGAAHDEPIRFGRLRRRVRLVYPGIKHADMGWAEALADIEEAKRDPGPATSRSSTSTKWETRRPGFAPKPWDDPAVTGKPVPVTVQIPPPD